MKRIPTQGSHKRRSLASASLIAFILLIIVVLNFGFLITSARGAYAAASIPATTPTPTPPPLSVSISSPTNGSLYGSLTQIPITATATISASNPGGTITRVEFYGTTNNNTTLLGTSTAAPYSTLWVSHQGGNYTLTAKAYDNFGHVATSAPVTVLVAVQDPVPPTVTITSPTNNSIHPWKIPFPIVASVTDSDPNVTIARVEFYNGTTLLGTSTIAPYSITWTAPLPGTYTLTAKAYDNYGDIVTSAPVIVFGPVIDPVPPIVTITSPANNTRYNAPATVMITATATDAIGPISKVDFYSGSTLLGTSTAAPYSFTWTNVPAGTYTLKAVVTDATYPGVTGTSTLVTITVLPSSTPTCKVSYQLSSQWPGGFQANIAITNTGTTTINSWVLKFTFPGDQKITNLWNGNYTQAGEQMTITNQSWNGTIAPKGSIGLGFNSSWTNNNTNPTSFTLNGQVCN